MARQQHADQDFLGTARILNLPAPASGTEPARLDDLNAAIEGVDHKPTALVRVTSNVNLASPGATHDGESPANGDYLLLTGQTATEENGLYVFNGAATPATRAPEMSLSAEFNNAIVGIAAGTDAGKTYRQTATNPTVGTTPIAFVQFGTSASAATTTSLGTVEIATQAEVNTGTDTTRSMTPETAFNASWRVRGHTAQIGNGSATQFDITHNFGTRLCIVQVYRTGSPYDEIEVNKQALDTNTTRIIFDGDAPTSNQFTVLILKVG